ncbi:MAG: asparagine synthetase B family protein, partial [Pseudanabaenaceae cyanobacterium]
APPPPPAPPTPPLPPPAPARAWTPSRRFVVVGETTGEVAISTIAKQWEEGGIDSLIAIRSFFALVIWDCQEELLYLCRDGVGGKTLYYTISGKNVWIAPRLKTLLPYHKRRINLVALRDYLCCAFVPGTQTMWQDVQELAPGTVLCFPSQTLHIFWQPQSQIRNKEGEDLNFWATELRQLLNQIVQEKLPRQGAVGVFLSGGIDSSAVTALAAQLHPEKVICYSIHFGKDLPHELHFSSLVARHYHLPHVLLEISFQDMWQQLPATMALLDNPIGDPLTVPNLLLAKLAKQSVDVILNGEGGDPCFGGPKNQPMLLSQIYGSSLIDCYARSFHKCFDDLPQLLRPEIWELVKEAPFFFAPDLNTDLELLQRLFLINIKYKGANHILTKVNNLLTAVGLQGRSPLFDPRIVEFSLRLPLGYKVTGAAEKIVLKQAMANLLPQAIIDRPKSGMMVPVQLGFQKYWQRQACDLLLGKDAPLTEYLQPDIIRSWLAYKGDPWRRYGVKLWLLVSLAIWLQQNR